MNRAEVSDGDNAIKHKLDDMLKEYALKGEKMDVDKFLGDQVGQR